MKLHKIILDLAANTTTFVGTTVSTSEFGDEERPVTLEAPGIALVKVADATSLLAARMKAMDAIVAPVSPSLPEVAKDDK